jgi:hypothetical protein
MPYAPSGSTRNKPTKPTFKIKKRKKCGTMFNRKSGIATDSETVATKPRTSVILEEMVEVITKWRVGNHVLLFLVT